MVPTADREVYRTARCLFDERRYPEALSRYETLASAGDPQCQVFAGWMIFEGLGSESNLDRAFDWFHRAAELGSKQGAFYCGRLEIARNRYADAFPWFQHASAQGYGPALFWLGLTHLRGWGRAADYETGVKYLRRAADVGHLPARRELALLMIRGKFGAASILKGLVLLPYAVVAALIEGLRNGHTDKLIG